jgi:hypothetical protein
VPNLLETARDAMNPVAGGIVGLPGGRQRRTTRLRHIPKNIPSIMSDFVA